MSNVLFEDNGWNVIIRCINKNTHPDDYKNIGIEIKPQISDDFPAVLRQIKNLKTKHLKPISSSFNIHERVLLVKEYSGKGATQDEFESFFKTQGITVLYTSDLIG